MGFALDLFRLTSTTFQNDRIHSQLALQDSRAGHDLRIDPFTTPTNQPDAFTGEGRGDFAGLEAAHVNADDPALQRSGHRWRRLGTDKQITDGGRLLRRGFIDRMGLRCGLDKD